ncbi:MAG TPA: ABC transporter ATP-binding protein [Vicinamibacterales bacterium]|nr:ABC transporter ATP-binding protein [Vicinamibacterales bacterium]
MLAVSHLSKAFGAQRAVDDVSFGVDRGRIVGLLGPNGAGKTTTVSMIAGLVRPDGGEVLIDGRALAGDTDPLKRRLGLVPQDLALYEELSAAENLHLFGALYGMSRAETAIALTSALAFVGLTERARDRVSTFSGGMKRRLNLAAGLLHDPPILLLDEPTVGVDPQSRNAIFDNLEALRRQGKALLYTTHYMEEAERLCDRIVIIDHGRVVADDTLRGLYARLPSTNRLTIELDGGDRDFAVDDLRRLPGVRSAELARDVLTVGLDDVSAGAPAVLQWLSGTGRRCTHLASERGNLETVFLALTGRSLRDA